MERQNQYFPQVVYHPGETLAEKLTEMGMGSKEFAIRTGKPEKTITAILNGNSAITPDMAVQFEKVTQIPARFWSNAQRDYDEFQAKERQKKILEGAKDWTRQFPLADMAEKGWIPKTKDMLEKSAVLLSFFGFASHTAWENYFFNQQLKVAFRISLANTREPYAISAWLRKGEIDAAELNTPAYSEKSFKAALPEIKRIMTRHPDDFFEQLRNICLSTGVKLVHTPCLPKAPINGATRWLSNMPLIQLTGRYKRNDIFWFTFFHEAGHILLHGKKDIFLEDVDYPDKDRKKEKEADDFAVKWTLTKEQEAEIEKAMPLSEEQIRKFATKFDTHPAIIIGRLQHKKRIPYSFGKGCFEPVVFT